MANSNPEYGMRQEWSTGLQIYRYLSREMPSDSRLVYAAIIQGQLLATLKIPDLHEVWRVEGQRDFGIGRDLFPHLPSEHLNKFRDAGYGLRCVEILTRREIQLGQPLPNWIGEFASLPRQVA